MEIVLEQTRETRTADWPSGSAMARVRPEPVVSHQLPELDYGARPVRSKTSLAVLCGGLVLGVTVGAAEAQTQAPVPASPQVQTALPASLERATLVSWLRTNTDMDPGAVISVSPANIIGLMAVNRVEPATRRLYRAQIRAEVISAQTIREAGNNSWAADVDVDCDTRKGKVNRILDFPMRNLRGKAREAGGSAEWVVPPSGTHLHTVVAAVCDGNFQRPLGVSPRVAAVQPAPAPAASAPMATAAPQRLPVQPAPSTVRAAPAQASPTQSAAAAPRPAQPELRPRIDEAEKPYTTAAPTRAPAQASPQPPVQAAAPRPPAAVPPQRSAAVVATAVQISASSSEALASQALRSVRAAFPDRTRGLAVKTVPVQSNGRTVYRVLFHGFHSASEARGFCSALKASGRDCFLRDGVGVNARMISQ